MKKSSTLSVAVILSFTTIAAWSQAPQQQPPQPPSDQQGISRLQADIIISELRQIRELLEKGGLAGAAAKAAPAQEVPTRAKLKLEGSEWLGDEKAPVTIVEYADYQCPFCRQFHQDTYDKIIKDYVDTGKVRYTARDLPLDFHPNALGAAQAARCAGDQKQFWKMRNLLIANNDKLSLDEISGYAKSLKLNMTTFKSCMDTGKYKDAVQKESADASALSISGTPSFVIGASTADGVDGVIFVGAQPYADFEAKIKEAKDAAAKP